MPLSDAPKHTEDCVTATLLLADVLVTVALSGVLHSKACHAIRSIVVQLAHEDGQMGQPVPPSVSYVRKRIRELGVGSRFDPVEHQIKFNSVGTGNVSLVGLLPSMMILITASLSLEHVQQGSVAGLLGVLIDVIDLS